MLCEYIQAKQRKEQVKSLYSLQGHVNEVFKYDEM